MEKSLILNENDIKINSIKHRPRGSIFWSIKHIRILALRGENIGRIKKRINIVGFRPRQFTTCIHSLQEVLSLDMEILTKKLKNSIRYLMLALHDYDVFISFTL